MKKTLILLLFQLILATLSSQNERHIKSLFEEMSYKKRGKIFLKLSKTQSEFWYKKYFEIAVLDTFSVNTIEEIKKNIHFVDLNNDTFPDVVDESNNGSSPVLVYLNDKGTFKMLIDEDESQLKTILKYKDRTEIITQRLGMVMAYTGEARYVFKDDSIKLLKRRFRQNCTVANKLYRQSVRAKVKNDSTPFREYAGVGGGRCTLDSGEGEYNQSNNIMARLELGKEILIWGEFKNEFGQEWYLVEVLIDEKYRKFEVGWVSKNDVKRV